LFNVSLRSDERACQSLNAAVKVDAESTATLVEIAFLDIQTAGYGRHASDFELLLLKDGLYSVSQFIGGNPYQHINYGERRLATFDVTYQQYLTECVYWTDYTNPAILAGFDEVCIYNACGSYNVFCTDFTQDPADKRTFLGQVIINGFKTTTQHGNAVFDPPCTPKDSKFIYVPTPLPTTAPPSTLLTAKPSTAPSVRPSRVPTAIPTTKPSPAPSIRPTRVPTAFTTAKPSRSPTIIPTRVPSSSFPTRKPTSKPTIKNV